MNWLKLVRFVLDLIDLVIFFCLWLRYRLVLLVIKYKIKHGLPFYQPQREAQIISRMEKWSRRFKVPGQITENVFRNIISELRNLEESFGQREER